MSIIYGSDYIFNSAYTSYISTIMLDSTHVLIAYRDDGNSDYGTAVIATISGSEITFGSEYVYNSGGTDNISATMLDSTHVLIAYRDTSGFPIGATVIATISGSEIVFGSEYTFNFGTATSISTATLDSTHVLIAYRASSGYGTAVIATISGTTITYGSKYVFNSASTIDISATMLDSTHILITYRDISNSDYGTAVIATINGTTITYGSDYIFNSAYTSYISTVTLDSTHVLIAYSDNGNSDYGTAVIATISGTTISYGSEYVFNSASTGNRSTTMLDSTHVLIAYRDNGNSDSETAIIATISGSEITFDSEYVFSSGVPDDYGDISVIAIDSTHALIAFCDVSNSGYGTTIIASIQEGLITIKVWNGSSWIDSTAVKYYDGVSWVDITALNRSDGATWVTV